MIVLLVSALLAGCSVIRPPARVDPKVRTLTVTGYCPCGKCCGWKRNWYGRPVFSSGSQKGQPKPVGVTASGSRARHGTIAADTSIYPFGTVMYIEGYGYGRVEDRGGGVKGQHIDVFFRSHRAALNWGRQTVKVKIWLP